METWRILLSLAIAMAAGLFISRFAKIFKLPAVTGYLIAGVLVGPYVLGQLGVEGLGFVNEHTVETLSIICDVALGFIAFAIGNEFRLSQLKRTGKQATIIGIFQAVVATLFVDAALIGLHFLLGDKFPLPVAICLGAIASATAPAATLMVVRQYKAEGKLTDLLLPVVALDDAVGLIIFAVSFGLAKAVAAGGTLDIISVVVNPIVEIVMSILLGALMGVIFSLAEKFFKSNSKRLSLAVTTVILTVALSMIKFNIGPVHVGFSSLLVCMMLGTVFCNMCDFSEEIMGKTDKWTAPILMLFFVLSGAELNLGVFANWLYVFVGVVYILFRSAGKILGARWSAGFVKCDSNIKKYLGITLLPQAGVALGMASIASAELGAFTTANGESVGGMILNIVLFGVLIYELVGPLMTKIALTKAGDIHPIDKNSSANNSSAEEEEEE